MPPWLIPIVYLVVSLLAAQIIPRIEYSLLPAYGNEISVSTAQTLLGSISSGLLAFTAIVFSIAFLLVQYTATAASKRFILLAGRNPVIFHAFGVFVATFTFALGTLAFVNRQGSNWVPMGSLIIVAVLLAISIGLLARLIHQVAELRITRIIANIGDSGRAAIAAMPARRTADPGRPLPQGEPSQIVRHPETLMVLRAVDVDRLVRLARDAAATIRLEYAVGDMVFPNSTVACVYGGQGRLSEAMLLASLRLERENLYDNDVRFALRLLVDTAIMALSPAVNDPTTATEAIDQIEDLMLRLGRRQLDTGRIADETGALRLVYPAPAWSDYLSLAFDEIRLYGRDALQVRRRLRAALIRLAAAVEDGPRRDAVLEYRRRLDADVAAQAFDAADRLTAMGIDPQGLGLSR